MIILTRSEPLLPLARLRARGELCEVSAADLRFSQAETQRFFQQTLDLPLSPEASRQLNERLAGWAAGLRLLMLALRSRASPQAVEEALATFAGSHRPILEYFVAEVLSVQPALIQAFLLRTSVLGRLNGSLCDAVLGRHDSAELLAMLDRASLFLEPLDESEQWYRYHALFAEAMQHEARRRFGDAALHRLAQRASLWHEQHGMLAEAVEAA
jgi:LuxR family maltose regulon positive regulatory protein